MNTFRKTGLAFAAAVLLVASPALACNDGLIVPVALPGADDIIAELERETYGVVGGSIQGAGTYDVTWVDVFGEVVIDDSFKAGTSVIALVGDGADLDLYVYDMEGNELCASYSEGPIETCQFELDHEAEVEIVVSNFDEFAASEFVVWTN